MKRHGWLLLFHDCMVEQLQKLLAAAERAERSDPEGYESNANVKLFRALSRLIMDTVPSDPAREEYRLGNTMGRAHRHWRRAKIGRRFRLFFRYDSRAKTIIFAWINNRCGLRAANPILTSFSRRCSSGETHRMTGQAWSPRVERIGLYTIQPQSTR